MSDLVNATLPAGGCWTAAGQGPGAEDEDRIGLRWAEDSRADAGIALDAGPIPSATPDRVLLDLSAVVWRVQHVHTEGRQSPLIVGSCSGSGFSSGVEVLRQNGMRPRAADCTVRRRDISVSLVRPFCSFSDAAPSWSRASETAGRRTPAGPEPSPLYVRVSTDAAPPFAQSHPSQRGSERIDPGPGAAAHTRRSRSGTRGGARRFFEFQSPSSF